MRTPYGHPAKPIVLLNFGNISITRFDAIKPLRNNINESSSSVDSPNEYAVTIHRIPTPQVTPRASDRQTASASVDFNDKASLHGLVID